MFSVTLFKLVTSAYVVRVLNILVHGYNVYVIYAVYL